MTGSPKAITRLWTWFMATVIAATVLVIAEPVPTRVHAAPLEQTPFITWNMQGSSGGRKWTDTVARLAPQVPLMMLQEVGPTPPPHSNRPGIGPVETLTRGNETVTHTRWTWGTERTQPAPAHIYFLQTDSNGGTAVGGRVNTAILSHAEPDEVQVVTNPVNRGRTALGVRFGDDWYFSFHGLSGGGGDSTGMIDAIAGEVYWWSVNANRNYTWTVGGDLNVTPAGFTQRGTSTLAYLYDSEEATHQTGYELDYAVASRDVGADYPAYRLDGAGSDHYPVQVGGVRASGEVLQPPLREDIVLDPAGDSTTFGENSTDKNGYRLQLYDDLVGEPLHTGALPYVEIDGSRYRRDFVGDQRSGNLPDPDHDGVSGERIDEIMERVDCTVPALRPNIVTLHVGLNDMNQQWDLPNAPRRAGALIDQILADAPETVVILASVIPASKPGMQPRIDAFNAALPGLVKERQDKGKHVLLAPMDMVPVAEVDGAHPNDAGYRKMAEVFGNAIWRAHYLGWIKDPVSGNGQECPAESESGSKAGPGWRSLGVVAPGMTSPEGRTDLADFNGDQRADYVRIPDEGPMRIALNTHAKPGKPHWVEVSTGITVDDAERFRFADLNGDGRDDLVLINSSSDGWLVYQENKGVKDGRITWNEFAVSIKVGVTGVRREAVRFADVNGDGRDDYLRVGDSGAVHAYLNLPTEDGWYRWEEVLNWAPGVSYGSRDKLRLADVNGDRRADYLMVGGDGSVHAYINNGLEGTGPDGRRFTEHLDFVRATGYPGDKSAFRDISGDGKADYVLVYGGGSVRAWLNRGGNT
ncbi:FG-GAP-like repeat-containing protein [Streptomyces sp. NPDC057474]|uniref:FG-GAP-like repeat-containing protein n=1 Tax=Streptomyces sp. NPDC057474 TaxID=3346144 RepID=UPI0036C10F78